MRGLWKRFIRKEKNKGGLVHMKKHAIKKQLYGIIII
jgi:hypothetical protein